MSLIVDVIDYVKGKISEKLKLVFYGAMTVSVIGNVIFGVSLHHSAENQEGLATSVQIALTDFKALSEENELLSSTIGELTGELDSSIDYIISLKREADEKDLVIQNLETLSEQELEGIYDDLKAREQAIQEMPINQLIADLEAALSTYKY